jgi:hypothetical protein
MRVRLVVLVTVLALVVSALPAEAQVGTGEIFGRVTDNTGAVLPGVTVTLSGPALLQPMVATTSETGSYQFPRLPIGTYTVVRPDRVPAVVREGIRVDIGFSAQINQQLAISTVQELVTVTGESPVVDTRSTTAKTSFDLETLQSIPSARDPWVMLERVPNIAVDRINVGGTQSGQQSGYISRGSGRATTSGRSTAWTSPTCRRSAPRRSTTTSTCSRRCRSSPAAPMRRSRRPAWGSTSSPAAARTASAARAGSTRWTTKFQSDNLTDEVKLGGVGGGAPIQAIKDYGVEVGGPIRADRLWYWGSYSKQDIKAGIPGFYLPSAQCQQMKATLAADRLAPIPTKDVRACLGTDGTELNNYNWKISWAPSTANRSTSRTAGREVQERARRVRHAADRDDLRAERRAAGVRHVGLVVGRPAGVQGQRPARVQRPVRDGGHVRARGQQLPARVPGTGPARRAAVVRDQHERVGPLLPGVGLRAADRQHRPHRELLPAGALGGDHSFKMGYRWRTARAESINHRGGNIVARFRGGVPAEADVYRDGNTNYRLNTHGLYLQDTMTVNRLTLNLGLRFDSQTDKALPSTVPENPIIPDIMPGIDFPGANAGVTWNDVSPRIGLTYDISGTGRSVLRTSYSTYYGQLNTGGLTSNLVAIGAVFVRYPWKTPTATGSCSATSWT